MSSRRKQIQLLVIGAIFAAIICVCIIPTQLSLIQPEKVAFTLGNIDVTVNDVLVIFGIFGSAITIGLFFVTFVTIKKKTKRVR